MSNKIIIPHSSYEQATQNGHGANTNSRKRLAKDSDVTKLRTARDKITRVFRYLEALNQHRNPVQRQIGSQPWSLWLHELPSHIEQGTRAS